MKVKKHKASSNKNAVKIVNIGSDFMKDRKDDPTEEPDKDDGK